MKVSRVWNKLVRPLAGAGALLALASAPAIAPASVIVLDDFSGPLSVADHPNGAGQYNVWYDASHNTFGTVVSATLDGSAAGRINDGGFTNGVYIIYPGAIPSDGEYVLEIEVKIIEDPANANGIRAWQVGAAAGAAAQHRATGTSFLPGLSTTGNYAGTLTTADNTSNPKETIATAVFTAQAGDDVLVALGTDVQSGGWNLNSGTWGTSHVLMDNIVLRSLTPPEEPEVLVVEDFAGGVFRPAAHPNGAGVYGAWYDASHNTFGGAAAATLEGDPAMRITDGGFTNGLYAIYQGAVPQSGTWQLQVEMKIIEDPANSNGIRAYQVGVANGAAAQHRGAGTTFLPGLTTVGTYGAPLTTADNTSNPTQVVQTGTFEAAAGDDLLIAFGTDVSSGGWNLNSGTWGTSHVLIDNIVLIPINVGGVVLVADNDDGAPVYTETGSWTLSGSTGYNGGTYKFASAGAAATATWTVDLPRADLYEVAVQFRAGTNRATQTRYEVTTAAGTEVAFADQTGVNLDWVTLGTYSFGAGPASVTLDAAGSSPVGTVVIADAVRFRTVDGPLPPDPPEMRLAVITVFDPVASASSIQAMVNQIASLNYNAIAVHARYRGDATYFPNKTNSLFPNNEPRSPAAGSVDVLEQFVTHGHAAGLKVYAYVNTHLVTDGANSDARPNHVVNVHPDWITWAYNGGSPIPQTTATDSEGLWLEPALPEVRYYIADICGDIMMNYACDGIILDRIRYPQTAFTRANKDHGYHPQAIAAFNAAYGKSGIPSPSDPDWIQFRRDQITLAVQEIHNTITAIDPANELLAYPIGRFSDAINFNYQEWTKWLNAGVIDGVLPQIYSTNNGTFSSVADQHLAAYGGERLLGVTLNAFTSGVDVDGQIAITRAKGFDGVSPFRHGTMGALGYFNDLNNVFLSTAPWPDMPWKALAPDTTPPAAPANLALVLEDDAIVVIDWDNNAEADLAGYNVYRSTVTGGPYDKISSMQTRSRHTDTAVDNGTRYYYVVTAVDYAGNESDPSGEATGLPELPATVIATALANGEQPTSGTVTGNYADTHAADGVSQSLTEVETDGNKFNVRTSKLEHLYTFEVSPGRYHNFVLEASRTDNDEGDDFLFSYSRDGVSFVPMLLVDRPAGVSTTQVYTFPEDVAGTLLIRVEDTDRTGGHTALDTLSIDYMGIDTYIGRFFDFSAPFAVQNLVAAEGDGIVALSWDASPEADLAGYNVYRATTAGGPFSKVASLLAGNELADTTVTNATQYRYHVTAEDIHGNESAPSNTVLAVPYSPDVAQVMSILTIRAMKVKDPVNAGYKHAVAEVVVVDNLGVPVANAVVTGRFSGDFDSVNSAVTNQYGVASVQSSESSKGGLHFTFTVEDASHATLTYNPNLNGDDSDSF